MENEVNLPYICLFWSWDWDYFSWNCSYNFEMCTFLSSKYVETCLLYSNFRYRVRPKLKLNLTDWVSIYSQEKGKKLKIFGSLRHFWLLIKKGAFSFWARMGAKILVDFCVKLLSFWLNVWRSFCHIYIWISFLLGLYKICIVWFQYNFEFT